MTNRRIHPVGTLGSVLVTGAAGFIGSHLVDLLLAEGWDVVGLDNFDGAYDPQIKRANVAPHLENAGYRLVEADVCDYDQVRERVPRNVQVVVHVAALTVTERGVTHPVHAAEVNFRGGLNLMELCRKRGVRQFVLASCGSVYGVASGLPWKEDTIPVPVNPLDGAKLATEQFGHCYARLYGMQFVSVRLFNVYGPRENPGAFMPTLLDAIVNGTSLRVPGDVHARRDFTYVDDAVRALRLAMSFGAAPSDVFNIGSGSSVSVMELVHELEALTDRRASLRLVARKDGDLLDSWCDVGKARRTLGFRPQVPLRTGLQRYLKWYMSR
jgi:UDP-glucuronate 4-epimerase